MSRACSIAVIESDTPTGPIRLALGGRVAVESVTDLYRTAVDLARRNRDVTVCCRDVEYLDAAAVQVVLCLGRELEVLNRTCDLTGLTGRVRTDFGLIGLAHVLPDE